MSTQGSDDVLVDEAKRAVVYLRVSTAKQADKDADPEGYSLPAQRDACLRKAEQMGVEVVEEYLDRGESAKTADRPAFLKMLSRIRDQQDVDFVILHKIDRFARNRRDDANVLFELKVAGAQLVSVSENIDETPAGMLVHGILATIAEWESRKNGVEALKGMTQKAKVGGTPGRAPIGYLNIRDRIDGREVRTVAVDPERASLVQWAFEEYSKGDWTLTSLTEALAARGLRALPNGRENGVKKPLQRPHVAAMLKNRYYIGFVKFRGTEYPGRHQPLVTHSTFEAVQYVLNAHRSGSKERKFNHYLKGTVFCARCGSRLCLTNAKGIYLYFFCVGRHQKRTNCDLPYLAAEKVEEAVRHSYKGRRLEPLVAEVIQDGLTKELERQRSLAGPEMKAANRRQEELEQERRRLARGVVEGSIPNDLAREEQDRIAQELEQARRIGAASQAVFANIETGLELSLKYLGQCDDLYDRGNEMVRRLSNRALFDRVLVDAGIVVDHEFKEPWATLVDAAEVVRDKQGESKRAVFLAICSKIGSMVPPAGFEHKGGTGGVQITHA